jgi:hypothetical protein
MSAVFKMSIRGDIAWVRLLDAIFYVGFSIVLLFASLVFLGFVFHAFYEILKIGWDLWNRLKW